MGFLEDWKKEQEDKKKFEKWYRKETNTEYQHTAGYKVGTVLGKAGRAAGSAIGTAGKAAGGYAKKAIKESTRKGKRRKSGGIQDALFGGDFMTGYEKSAPTIDVIPKGKRIRLY